MSRLRHHRRQATVAWLLAFGAAAVSMDARCEPSFDGNGSARMAAWSHSRDLDDAGVVFTASAWGRGSMKLDGDVTIVADGWAQVSGGRRARPNDDTDVRELYAKARLGAVDVRIGRQIIVWGRADALNPTDSVGRRDYSRLTVDDADQRDGADSACATWFIGADYSLQMLALVNPRSDILPLRLPPTLTLETAAPRRQVEFATKLDRTNGAVDWSLSYYEGHDRLPDLGVAGVGSDGVRVLLSSHSVRTTGVDFSTEAGGTVWRGEAAWSQRDAASGADGYFRKRSQLMVVLGGDRDVGDGNNVNLQLFGQWVPGYRDPDFLADPVAIAVARVESAIGNQPGKHQYGATWRLARAWANETWHAEFTGVHSFTTHANVLRAQVRHDIDDRWRVNAGIEAYRGSVDTAPGQLKNNSTAYVELRTLF